MSADIALLEEIAEFLEVYSDVRDGDDGRPLPNKAMSLLQQVEREIEALKRARCANDGHCWVGIGDEGKVVCDDCGIDEGS